MTILKTEKQMLTRGQVQEILKTEKQMLTRGQVQDLEQSVVTGDSIVDTIVNYIDGGQRLEVQRLYGTRYCRRITKDKDGNTYSADPTPATQAAVDANLFEIIVLETMNKIIREVADLNTDTEYAYASEDGEELDEFAADMQQARADGDYLLKLGRVDELSVATGSSGMLIQVLGSKLDYQPLASSQIKIVFADQIMDGDTWRPTNTLDIEEASIVVVELSESKNNAKDRVFVAIFPRSEMYPKGRMVKYEGTDWAAIPNVGHADANDHMDSAEEVANPLTVLQNDSKDWTRPEIPVVLWRGTTNGIGKELLPTSEVLFQQDKEINLSACRALTAGIKSATGVIVLNTEVGGSPVMPDQVAEGITQLKAGQSLNILSVPAINADRLMASIESIIAFLSESFGVPNYKLTINNNLAAMSGEALIQLNRTEMEMRQRRADINRGNVDRIFNIEMALAAIDNDDQTFGNRIKQAWIVGSEGVIKSDLVVIEETERLKAVKAIDERGVVRALIPEFTDATDEAIDEYLDGFKEEPAPPQQPALNRLRTNATQ
jgi:hypothetical protein